MIICRTVATAGLALAIAASAPAAAQSLNDLSKGLMSGQGAGQDGGSLLGSLSSGSLSLGSAENAAGVLGYCQKQGYAPDAATTVKDKLMSKIGGQQKASQDNGYLSGLGGLLQGGDGKSFDLTRLKDVAGKKICATVADRALSSFLGG